MVILPEGNFLNPFGVRRAPSEPASAASVVKNPASKSHFKKHLKMPCNRNFLSFIANGDSPPSYLSNPYFVLDAIFFSNTIIFSRQKSFCVGVTERERKRIGRVVLG